MSDVICLDHSPTNPYRCVLWKGHDGPHKAFQREPEKYPGCVWPQADAHV